MKKAVSTNRLLEFFSKHRWSFALGGLIALYVLIFGYISLERHWSIGSYYYDLGIMHQVVYNSSQGHILQLTDPNSVEQISRFAIHFDPLMLLLVPFYWILPRAEMLIIGQTLFLASGAVPVYLLAQFLLKKLKNVPIGPVSTLFAFIYLNYVPLQRTNIFDFHAVVLVTPLLLWAMYFIETKKYYYSLPFLFLSLFGKENVALTTFMIGLYLFFIKKERNLGAAVSVFSVLFFGAVIGFVIPSHRADLHFAESYYTKNPLVNLQRLFSKDSYNYIFNLLKPAGFLPIFAPLQLIISAPEWALNLLSSNANMREIKYHYTALITPFIMLSTIFGWQWMFNYLSVHLKKIKPALLILLLSVIPLTFSIQTTLRSDILKINYPIDQSRLKYIQLLAARFNDPKIPLSTTGHLAAYFSGRQYFYNFLFDFAYASMNRTDEDLKKSVRRYEKADYIILQKEEVENDNPLVDYYYQDLVHNPKYELSLNKNGIEIYHKKGTPEVDLKGI